VEVGLNGELSKYNLPLLEDLFVFSENFCEFKVSNELDRIVEVAILRLVFALELCSGELKVHHTSDLLILLTLLVVKVALCEEKGSFCKFLGIFRPFPIRSDA
jgi:hypothetical protein